MKRGCSICNTLLEKCSSILQLHIAATNISKMDPNLEIFYCNNCYFYFTSTNSIQEDYDYYYSSHNNYTLPLSYYSDKNNKTVNFINNKLKNNVKTILDYGCGNGNISDLLENNFTVTRYDFGYDPINSTYDCVLLSHILEHIYNIDLFLSDIKKYINTYIYIEVPNAEEYHIMQPHGPLHEINFEHINFFSKYALNKLMIKHGFIPVCIEDDVFKLSNMDYPVIRGIFKLSNNNGSFKKYIQEGQERLNKIQTLSKINGNVYIYGCGHVLYKIIIQLSKQYNIISIIDDNPNFDNRFVNNIPVLSFATIKNKIQNNDTIIITTTHHLETINSKLNTLDKKVNIINLGI
jgi:hypothetical protein